MSVPEIIQMIRIYAYSVSFSKHSHPGHLCIYRLTALFSVATLTLNFCSYYSEMGVNDEIFFSFTPLPRE